MTRADLDLYHGDPSALPDDILREQKRVERADMLVFVFPVYWWSVPALLKGWFDRVLTLNWAYKVADDGRIVGNLRDVPVRLIATGGSDLTGFDKHGYSTAIQTQIIEGVFGFCGLKNVKLEILYQQTRLRLSRLRNSCKDSATSSKPYGSGALFCAPGTLQENYRVKRLSPTCAGRTISSTLQYGAFSAGDHGAVSCSGTG